MSIRVHELAKRCGISNVEMMEKLHSMKYPVRSVSSTIDNITAEGLEKQYVYVPSPPPPPPSPEPPPPVKLGTVSKAVTAKPAKKMGASGQLELLQMATADIAKFLNVNLPKLGSDWWKEHVFDRLSVSQQQTANERGFSKLQQFDFAALLRILDKNWNELNEKVRLPKEARSWVNELRSVRNKWAHPSAELIPASETYRDYDTLCHLLVALSADPETLLAVDKARKSAMTEMLDEENKESLS